MRIIAGEHKGRPLQAPVGRATRPTTDRVRESLMSVIASARGGFEGAVVLDAFGGSGALGLEALSRGAACAYFFEKSSKAYAVLQKNVESLGYGPDRALLRKADVMSAVFPEPASPFDLVLLDPPYATDSKQVIDLVVRLDEGGLLDQDVVIAYEHSQEANDAVDGLLEATWTTMARKPLLASRRNFGDTVLDIIRW